MRMRWIFSQFGGDVYVWSVYVNLIIPLPKDGSAVVLVLDKVLKLTCFCVVRCWPGCVSIGLHVWVNVLLVLPCRATINIQFSSVQSLGAVQKKSGTGEALVHQQSSTTFAQLVRNHVNILKEHQNLQQGLKHAPWFQCPLLDVMSLLPLLQHCEACHYDQINLMHIHW